MKIANLAVAALSSLLLTIGGVDGSRGSTAINAEDPYLFLGHLSLRASEGGTDAPTSAPTPAPTTVDSSIVCPTDSYNRTTVHRSGDCTKAGICFNGDLQAHTIVECDVAGAIYDVNCVDPDTTGFHGCCTNNTAVTCPTPSPTSSPSATPSKTPVSFALLICSLNAFMDLLYFTAIFSCSTMSYLLYSPQPLALYCFICYSSFCRPKLLPPRRR